MFQLLVGIKDTNDHLVAVTLRTLSDLVPVLGAEIVIGGKRARLFNDGRPTARRSRSNSRSNEPTANIPLLTTSAEPDITTEASSELELPERPSPDGEEGETSTEGVEQSVDENLDNWEDWDMNENNREVSLEVEASQVNVDSLPQLRNDTTRKLLPNILELDIKSQVHLGKSDEVDFFQDMEPVIKSTPTLFIDENETEASRKLNAAEGDGHVEGWGDDECDWE